MIEIINNKSNITDVDVTETVIRVKALIINSVGSILLGHSHCEYQFPGGHVESHEDLLLALKRELKEETGLWYDESNFKMIGKLVSYYKDLPSIGKNRKIIIYYYEVRDDRIPNLSETNYTLEELDGKYTLRYVPMAIVKEVIKDNMVLCGDPSGIAGEMLEFLDKYLNDV